MLQVIIVYKSQFSVEIKLPQFCKVILYPYIMAGVQRVSFYGQIRNIDIYQEKTATIWAEDRKYIRSTPCRPQAKIVVVVDEWD